MKIRKAIAIVTMLTVIAGAFTGCGAAKESVTAAEKNDQVRTIRAVTGAAPRPFTYYDDNNQLTGQNIELVNAVFEKLPQYKLEWEVADFPSIFAGLDSDKYQLGVNNFAKNAEREEKYLFTDSIFSNAYIVVANKDINLPEKVKISDLAGYKFVGQTAVNSTTAVENYNEENPDAPILISYTEEDLNIQLQDLEAKKYDFLIIDKPMYFGYYQPEFGYDLNTVELEGYGVGEGMDSFLIVSKTEENEQLVKDINAALKEVIEEGKSKEINEKYFGEDYSPSYN